MTDTTHSVIVDFKITEYEDGDEVNQCTLRSRGDRDYLALAKRCIEAMGERAGLTAAKGDDSGVR